MGLKAHAQPADKGRGAAVRAGHSGDPRPAARPDPRPSGPNEGRKAAGKGTVRAEVVSVWVAEGSGQGAAR